MDPMMLVAQLEVCAKAIEAHRCEGERKSATMALNSAYSAWKFANGVEYADRDTPDWVRMMAGTKEEFEELERAKRRERNARKRLSTAIGRLKILPA